MKRLFLYFMFVVLTCAVSGCASSGGSRVVSEDKKDETKSQEQYVSEGMIEQIEVSTAPTLSPEESDFRNLKWGMNRTEVASVEGAGYKTIDENTIGYARIRVEGFPADAEYVFEDDKLVGATFFIEEKHEDLNQYMVNYEKIKEEFTKRFGPMEDEELAWFGDTYKNQPEKYLQAVSEDQLRYRAKWKTDRTNVTVVMSRRNYTICIGIKYEPIQ